MRVIALFIAIIMFLLTGCSVKEEQEENSVPKNLFSQQSNTSSSFTQHDDDIPLLISKSELSESLYYGRNSLVGREKEAYLEIVKHIKMLTPVIDIKKFELTKEQTTKIVSYIQSDYPQLYWCSTSYSYAFSSTVKSIEFNYKFSKNQILENETKIKNNLSQFLEGIDESMTDYEKVKIVHDNIVLKSSYKQSSNDQIILGLILDKSGVCASYARTFQYLCYKLGIQSLYVMGTSVNETTGEQIPHAWNLVKLDSDYYYVDTTWDDPITTNSPQDFISYRYFNITTKDINMTHTLGEENYPVPICTATKYNYFIKNNLMFEVYDNDTVSQIISSMKLMNQEGKNYLEFKFTNKQAYSACDTNLFKNSRFKSVYYSLSNGKSSVSYSEQKPFLHILW